MANKDIKLNKYIFNSVLIHLIDNDTGLNDLFEYSLLSKHCFKIFQTLLLSHKLILPFYKFIEYIIKNINKETTHSKKLFQFKHIESIRVTNLDYTILKSIDGDTERFDYPLINLIKSLNNNNNKRKRDSDGDGYSNGDGELKEEFILNDHYLIFKQFFNSYCPSLKRVTILNNHHAELEGDQDFTYGGFFKYKKLEINWNGERIPLSFNPDQDIENDVEFKYSFKFISNYKPDKVYIKTINSGKLTKPENMNDLLNYNSINSIHFINHPTPLSFIETIFKSYESSYPHLNSLHLEIKDTIKPSELISSFHEGEEGIQTNSSISKIILKHFNGYQCEYNNKDNSIQQFLQLIENNKTIVSLGLEVFGIVSEQDSNINLLSPLIKMNNLTTLYCNNYNIKLYLDHCNENRNIRKLVVSIYNNYRKIKIGYNYKSILGQFISTNNHTSLDTIKFVYFGYGRDYQLECYTELVNEINQLNTSGNGTLTFIHKNNKQFN